MVKANDTDVLTLVRFSLVKNGCIPLDTIANQDMAVILTQLIDYMACGESISSAPDQKAGPNQLSCVHTQITGCELRVTNKRAFWRTLSNIV